MLRAMPRWYFLLALSLAPACSLVTVQQEPFPPLEVTAKAPPRKPPRVVLTDSAIEIKEKVQFKLGSAELLPDSFPLLDEVAQMLGENPQISLLQVEGHTDSTGGAAINKKLSGERAKSVRAYLVARGIDKKRLAAKGFGPDRPIADNTTPEGQEANRRVEFNILKQGPKKVVVEEE
jgi:outer membrane protein OmpA-like peptidoglycan-associated protein